MLLTGDTPTESVEHARGLIAAYPDYRQHGYGRWAVVHKPSGQVIGFNGLKFLEDLQEVDLGYRFLPEFWGRGIATESSLAIVRHGFQVFRLERIIGLVMPRNGASIHVLEKVGMTFDVTIESFGTRVQKWSVEAAGSRRDTAL